jgi:predicted MFS family arabinose efflux permease
LIPSLIAYAIFGIVGAFVPGFRSLLVLRALLGISTGGLTASSMGLLGKFYHGEARQQVLAYASGALAIANICYPLLAGLLGSLGWRWAFCLYGLAIPFALISPKLLNQSGPLDSHTHVSLGTDGKPQTAQSVPLMALITDRQIFPILLAMLVTCGTIYVTFIYVPIYMRDVLQATTASIGAVLATTALGSGLIAAFGVRRLARTFGGLTTIIVAYGLMAAMLVAFSSVTRLPLMFAVAIVFGLAFGTIMPSLYGHLSERTPTEFQATILSMGTGLGFLGQFLSPIVLAPIVANYGVVSAFTTAALFALGTGSLTTWQLSQPVTSPEINRRF